MKMFLAALLFPAAALAQQQPSTAIDRVSVSFGQCVGELEKRNDTISDLQKRLSAAQERIKELEPKEPERKDK